MATEGEAKAKLGVGNNPCIKELTGDFISGASDFALSKIKNRIH